MKQIGLCVYIGIYCMIEIMFQIGGDREELHLELIISCPYKNKS